MIIRVHGTSFQNKGAELMMLAIIEEIKGTNEHGCLAIKTSTGTRKLRQEAGLYDLLDWEFRRVPRIRPLVSRIINTIPGPILKKTRTIPGQRVDAVLDASGFAYGDQWGPYKSELMEVMSKRWKREGKKVVLMPQAFGPFKDNRINSAMRNVVSNVDLLYARDQQSYNYLAGFEQHLEKIKIAPDFTVLLDGSLPKKYKGLKNRPCIVPNINMIEKTSEEIGREYVSFLGFCIRYLKARGQEPFILIHSADKDAELVKPIESVVGSLIKVIVESNALYLKGIIGQCNIVIGSRYHGLVSALSQATPCIAIGWSHKYKYLFMDYECQNFLLSPNDAESTIAGNIDYLVDESNRKNIIYQLSQKSLQHKNLVRTMWAEIHAILNNAG